jgi:hypothetical protein
MHVTSLTFVAKNATLVVTEVIRVAEIALEERTREGEEEILEQLHQRVCE